MFYLVKNSFEGFADRLGKPVTLFQSLRLNTQKIGIFKLCISQSGSKKRRKTVAQA